ncbi:MAG: tetratricopeptide repeat protein [Syntrophobacteraceae bacterium]
MRFPCGLLGTVLSLVLCSCLYSEAYSESGSVKLPDVNKIVSLAQMRAAVQILGASSAEAVEANRCQSGSQEILVTKTGECIGRLAVLHGKAGQGPDARKEEEALFLSIREILKRILACNKKVIEDLEAKLDQMEDPPAFMKSPEWRGPQRLSGQANYWLGWNAYYSSLLIDAGSPNGKTILKEGVEGFSQSFLSGENDAMAVSSLFGRGLLYKQLKAYGSAIKDFKSVQGALKKDDVLSVRSRYEEALVNYQSGNSDAALRVLEQMEAAFAGSKAPSDIRTDVKKLKESVLVALQKKPGSKGKDAVIEEKKEPETRSRPTHSELKESAAIDPSLNGELYRAAQENVESLRLLPADRLGPVEAFALGNRFFERQKTEEALTYYLAASAGSPVVMKNQMDILLFRIAYIYCKKAKWKQALPYVERFCAGYPESSLTKDAVSLYYAAAWNIFTNDQNEKTQQKLINAVTLYLKKCPDCPDRGEAHFQLGRYYQKKGNSENAVNEYSLVTANSPNFGLARYYLLELQVAKLEALSLQGLDRSEAAQEIYRNSSKLLDAYRDEKLKGSKTTKELEAATNILRAKLFLFGPKDVSANSVKELADFEKRFPSETALFTEAFNVRIEYYQRFQLDKEAEEEIQRFINASPIDEKRFAVLKNLADRYYGDAERLRTAGEAEVANRRAEIALAVYEGLLAASVENAAYGEHCQPLQFHIARIYALEGKPARAIEVYEKLSEKGPGSKQALLELGALYEKSGQWENVLDTWRKIFDQEKPGTREWLEARYKTIYALKMLGKEEKACALLTMTFTLHPDLGGDALKKQYLGLKSEICKGER